MIWQLLSGAVVGYLLATLSESLLHRYVGHASRRHRQWWSRIRQVQHLIRTLHFGHTVVHHAKTFKQDHVTQFADPHEQHQLDEHLREVGHSAFIALRYGLITDAVGCAYFAAPPAAVSTLVCVVCCGTINLPFMLSALLPILCAPLLSRYVHPYLHLPKDVAASQASWIVAALLSTPYGKWARIQHYVHHRHPRFNFNLLPGGDYLLRCHRRATASEIRCMQAIGLL